MLELLTNITALNGDLNNGTLRWAILIDILKLLIFCFELLIAIFYPIFEYRS